MGFGGCKLSYLEFKEIEKSDRTGGSDKGVKKVQAIYKAIPKEVKAQIDTKFKLLIGIPHNRDYMDNNFRRSIDYLKCYIGGEWFIDMGTWDTYINKRNGWVIHYEAEFPYEIARNKICEYGVKYGFTHIMMIDSDMTFNFDMPYRLLLHEKPIVYPVFYMRSPIDGQFYPAIFKKDGEKLYRYKAIDLYNGLFEDEFLVGAGCMLFETSFLKKLKYPYFKFQIDYNGNERSYQCLGEDLYFTSQILNAGEKICIDTDVVLGHDALLAVPYELNYKPSVNIQLINSEFKEVDP
jgi:hypothetical protein